MSESEGRAAPGAGLGRLTEEEAKLVAKLLSDPTYFPVEFRTWLKTFIEGSGIIITAGQVQGGQGTNIATGLPAGVILAIASSGATPADCLVCDGTAKVRADYPLLFDKIGTTWGIGDGSTTFNIPDLRDRALWGAGGRVGVAETDAVAFGSRGGPAHFHNISQTTNSGGAHSHGGGTGNAGGHQHGSVGDHAHGNRADGTPSVTQGVVNTGADGTARRTTQNEQYNTAPAGAHQHPSVGDHSHSISSDGSHTHVLSGPTSGGFLADKPSYAGVIYVITIGTSA